MRESLTIAVAQPLIVSYDVAANAASHAAAVREAGARVVVFPELSLTGYLHDAAPVSPDDDRLLPLVNACAETGSWALAGAPVRGDGNAVHIGVLAFTGEGASVAYRKMWLGAVEAMRFTPGESPAVVEVDGWRIGLAVCKDTGMAQHAAHTAALGIHVYAAGVLEHAEDAHIQNERAHRIATEHGVYVAIASFAGSTGEGYEHAAGRSAIWSPAGEIIAQAGPEVGAIARTTLDEL
jgi:predicted amidohydrolase